MDLFSYVITYDAGFAPNPFGELCTLATCKPTVRRVAKPGDWIAGLGSVRQVGAGRLVYAMQIAEVVSLAEYGEASRFSLKRPSIQPPVWRRFGDNIYFKGDDGQWNQRRQVHHGPPEMPKDLSGRNALIGHEFYYFGREAPEIPERFSYIIKQGPGHRRERDPDRVAAFVAWLRSTFPAGRTGDPWGRDARKGA